MWNVAMDWLRVNDSLDSQGQYQLFLRLDYNGMQVGFVSWQL